MPRRKTPTPRVDPDAVDPKDPDGLTHRQLAFIDHYLGDCRFNASKAALKAGYAHRQEGARNMSNIVVRARIDAELAAVTKTRDEILEMLADDATLDIDEVLARADLKGDAITRSSLVSSLMSARTTARGTLAKAYGLLSDRVQAGGGIRIVIEGVDEEAI